MLRASSALAVPLLLSLGVRSLAAQLPEERLRGNAIPTLAVVGVDVIPMDRPGVLRDHTVVVEDGVITRLGPSEDVAVPAGARIVDGTGRYLLPGLADMHAHPSWLGQLDLYLASGVTLARSMKGETWHLNARERIAAGRWTGPRLVLGGPILEGTPPADLAEVVRTDDKVLVDDSAAAARLVAVQAEWGYDFIKVYNNLPAAAYAGIVAEARERGVPVAGHVPFSVGLEGVGAGLLAGTDFEPAGFTLSWEMTEMVDAGLSPWDALLTATRNPARFLGEEDRWGTVTEGKLGNLVLLDDNPLADIGNVRSVAAVVVDGRLVEAGELRAIEEAACRRLRGES